MNFLWYILIGILSGFVAGKLMRGGGFGVIVNLIVGIIGGVLGGWLFGLLGISTVGIIGSLITSVVGAIFLLWIVGFLSRTVNPRQLNNHRTFQTVLTELCAPAPRHQCL